MSDEKLLLDYVYEHEKNDADKVYLTQPMGNGQVRDFTWAQAMDETRRMAAWLAAQGWEPGSRVGILTKNQAHFILSELAIWMAGHVSVALYPTVGADTARYCLEHSECRALFVGKLDDWKDVKGGIPDGLPVIAFPMAPTEGTDSWDAIVARTEPMADSPRRGADELALLMYTSGSTGTSKGVMHSFGAATRAAVGIVSALQMGPEDRMLSYLPLAHSFERAYVACPSMVAAFHVYFAESLDTFVADLRRANPTLFISVPRLWLKFQLGVFKKMPPGRLDLLLKIPFVNTRVRKKILDGLGLGSVRLAGSGSAPIPAELIAWYRKLGLNLMEGYAMSEDFAFSHLSTPEHNEPGYVGVPYPGVNVKLSDEGEILIDSPGKLMGYYKEPELTAECFTADGYFRTGDRGERKPSGLLKITGRVKELFKTSKGKYIAPAPIENLLNNDPNVELSMVSGSGMPQPYAQVVIAEELRPTLSDPDVRKRVHEALEALRKDVNAKVEHHEQLEFIVVSDKPWTIENAMLTPTMKIRRSAIEDATKARLEGWYETREKVIWA